MHVTNWRKSTVNKPNDFEYHLHRKGVGVRLIAVPMLPSCTVSEVIVFVVPKLNHPISIKEGLKRQHIICHPNPYSKLFKKILALWIIHLQTVGVPPKSIPPNMKNITRIAASPLRRGSTIWFLAPTRCSSLALQWVASPTLALYLHRQRMFF